MSRNTAVIINSNSAFVVLFVPLLIFVLHFDLKQMETGKSIFTKSDQFIPTLCDTNGDNVHRKRLHLSLNSSRMC